MAGEISKQITDNLQKWELVGVRTYKFDVPNGWLYRFEGDESDVMSFVPNKVIIDIPDIVSVQKSEY
jgi:hypothetical protein